VERVADAVIYNHDWCYDVLRNDARAGQPGYTDYWTDAAQRAGRARQ
jgi:hypothetical protein